jgi:hypothetical protein
VAEPYGLLKRETLDANRVHQDYGLRSLTDDPKRAVADSPAHADSKTLHDQTGIPLWR